METAMRLLLLNANASQSITDLVVAAARPLASPATELIGATGRFGPRYIGTRAAYAIASHAALDAYAAFGHGVDAVVLACFGDPGLGALREVATVPVIGMAEAGCRAAADEGRRFAIVTGGERWIPMLTEYVATLGLSAQLAGVHAVAPTGADIAADPEGSIALLVHGCRSAVKRFDSDVVVLGGAGLAPIAPRVAAMLEFPVIDGLAAAITVAEAAASAPDRFAYSDRLTDPLPVVGLTPELNALLQEFGQSDQ
jgi:Asp/Glu/hydantoin racemase